ncbi:MAG: hypothetical protein WA952_20930 [Lewinella sp.]
MYYRSLSLILACQLWALARLPAQSYDLSEAKAIFAALELEGLLTPLGAEEPFTENAYRHLRDPRPFKNYGRGEEQQITPAQILNYLSGQYHSAYLYRRGVDVVFEHLRSMAPASITIEGPEYDSILVANHNRLSQRAGTLTERRMEVTHPGTKWDTARLNDAKGMGLPRGGFTDVALPTARSVNGYDVINTLYTLNTIGVISSDTFDKYEARLQDAGLLPDYIVLAELAHAYAISETEDTRIKTRSQFVRRLSEQGAMNDSLYARLQEDTAFLRRYDAADFRTLIEPNTRFTIDTGATISILLNTLFNRICTFDARLCHLTYEFTAEGEPAEDYIRVLDNTGRYSLVYIGQAAQGDKPVGSIHSFTVASLLDIANEILRHDNAEYRLYAYVHTEEIVDSMEVFIYPLSSEAARTVAGVDFYGISMDPDGPDPDLFLSPSEVIVVRDTLAAMGLFDAMSEQQRSSSYSTLGGGEVVGIHGFFAVLPQLHLPYTQEAVSAIQKETSILHKLPGSYYSFTPAASEGNPIIVKLTEPMVQYINDRFSHWLMPVDITP